LKEFVRASVEPVGLFMLLPKTLSDL